ncbi:MAG: 4Fe-4S dicluster domain-containing protein [candidate division NC10 bacterium]|nr:4Fe-4S dicluster domain-containing protein [candidate division NC10 bacterium]
MKVGVFLEPWSDEIANFLGRKGIPTFPVPRAPRKETPQALQALIRRSEIRGAVLVEEEERLEGGFVEALQEAGIPPYAFEVVRFPPGPLEREAMEQAKLLTLAAVEGVRVQGEVDPEHLKPTFVSVQEALRRRDFLFGFFKPRYEVIPAVKADRCTAWKGCRLCLDACPQEAISFQKRHIVLDKGSCTACGACLPACPEEAISSPRLNPKTLDAQLRALLSEEVALRPRIILITAKDQVLAGRGSLPPEILALPLPCTGAISAWLLLRALTLGADGLMILPCAPSCQHRCHGKGWESSFRLVQALLPVFGVPSERLQTIPGEEPKVLASRFRTLVEEVGRMGPHRLQEERTANGSLRLRDLLRDLSTRLGLKQVVLQGDSIPFGLVKVEEGEKACTLCGVCPDRCPTGALFLQENTQTSKLLFDHASCVACFSCVEACPEKVLTVERELDFGQIRNEPTILAEDRITSCRRCGKPIAPSHMLQKVQPLFSPQPLDLEVCSFCRIFEGLKRSG